MIRKNTITLFCLLYSVVGHSSLLGVEQNYYEQLGLRKTASMVEIQDSCLRMQQSLGAQKKALEQKLAAAQNAKNKKEISALKKELETITTKINNILQVCVVLKDRIKKAEYDRKIFRVETERAEQERELKKLKTYCTRHEKTLLAQIAFQKQELENAQKSHYIDTVIRQTNNRITQLENELKTLATHCIVIENQDHPYFNKSLAELTRMEAEEKRGVFGSMKRKISNIPPGVDALVFQFLGDLLSRIKIPNVATKLFNQNIGLKNMQFLAVESSLFPQAMDPSLLAKGPLMSDSYEEQGLIPLRISGENIQKGLGFTGTFLLNQFTVKGIGIVAQSIQGKMLYSFSVELPEYYKISTIFPKFKKLDALSMPKTKLTISTFEYVDPDGFYIKSGLNFNALVDLSGPLKVFGDLVKAAGSMDLIAIQKNVQRARENIEIIERKIKKIQKECKTAANCSKVAVDLVAQKTALSVQKTQLAFWQSTLATGQLTTGIKQATQQAGEGRVGKVLKSITDSLFVRLEPIRFQGVIPKDLLKMNLSGEIPLQIGIDLTKIPKIPKSVTSIIKEFSTDELTFRLGPTRTLPPVLVLSIEGGIRLVLGTQASPIRLSVLGSFKPTGASVGARMRNMLDLKYFALGNAGIQFDFDQTLIAAALALGIPFTGIGVNGQIDIGTEGDKRVSLQLAGGMSVSTTKVPDIIFQAEANNIQFGNLISLFIKMLTKVGIVRVRNEKTILQKIPIMNVDRLRGHFAPQATEIAGKTYDAGFGFGLDVQLFDKKFGFSLDILTPTPAEPNRYRASGSGYLPIIEIKRKGKPVFLLSGSGSGGGASAYCNIDFSGWKRGAELPEVDDLEELYIKPEYEEKEVKKKKPEDIKVAGEPGAITIGGHRLIPVQEGVAGQPEKDTEKILVSKTKKWVRQKDVPVDLPSQEGKELRFERDAYKTFKEWGFGLNGRLVIPPIKLDSLVNFRVTERAFYTDVEVTYDEFSVVFGINFDAQNWKEMVLRFGFKGDFEKFLSKNAKGALVALKMEANKKLAVVDKKIGELSKELGKFKIQAGKASQAEIDKTKQTIAIIEGKIANLKSKCKRIGLKKSLICSPQVGIQLAAQRAAHAAQKTYLEALLKPTKGAVAVAADVLQKTTKAISDAQLVRKALTGLLTGITKAIDGVIKGLTIFKITEAIGQVKLIELTEGKLPTLVSLEAEIDIPDFQRIGVELSDIQFDFKNPKASAAEIVKRLLVGIRMG